MQSAKTIAEDFQRHRDGVRYVNRLGVEYVRKPGRRKKLSAADGAVIFDLLAQQHAARLTIQRILKAAGYETTQSQSRMMGLLWQDRGRVDVMRKANTKWRNETYGMPVRKAVKV